MFFFFLFARFQLFNTFSRGWQIFRHFIPEFFYHLSDFSANVKIRLIGCCFVLYVTLKQLCLGLRRTKKVGG